MRLHGGEMDIRSRLGEGTRVTVRLPIDGDGARNLPIRSSWRSTAPANLPSDRAT